MILPKFYPILDTEAAQRRGVDPVLAAGQILEGGARIIQFRHKGFLSREAFAWLEQIAKLARDVGAMLVINDHADLAKLFHAALHLGQDDLLPYAARHIVGPRAAIGFSTHNETQLRAAASEPVDYLALGPVFGTATKENPDPTVGLDELRRLRPLTARPLVAIGGITLANARQVLAAGADSVAVIGDLFPETGTVQARVEEWIWLLDCLPTLTTLRLKLRPWEMSDVDALHQMFTDPKVRKYLWDDLVIPRERVIEALESPLNDIGFWVIEEREGGPIIGFCGFRFLEDASEIELLYALLPGHWGRGLATEASHAALDYLWRSTAFERVWARTDVPNAKSVAVMQRLGMRHDSSTAERISYVLDRPV
jgi:thiamine-phosphate pyrophosphorylase